MATALPSDLWRIVCRYLGDSHMPSVAAFALVCKEWQEIATPVLHRSVSFVVTGKDRLVAEVDECYSLLRRTHSLRHVQVIEIAGAGPYTAEDNVVHPSPGWRLVERFEDFGDSSEEVIRNQGHPSLRLEHRIGQVKAWEVVPDSSWQPLAVFIARLPGLKDLIYNCSSTVPLCILRALDQYRCKLHVNTFKIPVLTRPLDQQFLQLIKSPCLVSIRAAFLPTVSRLMVPEDQAESYHDEEALMRLVAGVSPNLKKMVILRKHGGTIPHDSVRPHWTGFKAPEVNIPAFKRGSLRELALLHMDTVVSEDIEAWNTHSDFQNLLDLKITAPTSADALDHLANLDFPTLQALFFVVYKKQSSVDITPEAVDRFLVSIPRLSFLRLERFVHGLSILRIVEHHGSHLRKLWLLPTKEHDCFLRGWQDYYLPTQELLLLFNQSCLHLEDLAISIRRSKGDTVEVQTYRALGSLPRLRYLTLTLDASDYSVLWPYEDLGYRSTRAWPSPPTDSSFNDFDQEIHPCVFIYEGPRARNGHIRDAFINSAVDETLARAIFTVISSAKPPDRPLIQKLHLRTIGGGTFTSQVFVKHDIATVIDEIGRSWKFERDCRDDRKDNIKVKEMNRPRDELMPSRSLRHYGLQEPAESVFRQLWPATEKADWRQEWHSFPLASG